MPGNGSELASAAPSQTLSRGLRALEVIAEAEKPIGMAELAARLGLHRSITYRIVRTLEEHRLVVRTPARRASARYAASRPRPRRRA